MNSELDAYAKELAHLTGSSEWDARRMIDEAVAAFTPRHLIRIHPTTIRRCHDLARKASQ